MSKDTLTITDNRTARTYEIPIENDTIQAMHLRQIKVNQDDFGMMSYDPAFKNTASTKSTITYIDGDKGILRYRGIPIEQLAEKSNYLEVAYLILYGELPTKQQYAEWEHVILHHTFVHENITLLHEVIPLMKHKNGNPYLITTGASFGAYHAMNFGLRHPDLTNRILAMSGIYDISRWLDGYQEGHGYFNNPVAYIKNEQDGHRLHQLRNVDIIIAVGEQDPNIAGNRYFSQLLWDKNIWHAFRVWDGWSHDWPYWQKMVQMYIGGHD